MEWAITVMISIALIVFGGMTMAQGFLSSTDSAALSIEDITITKGEIMRTEVSLNSARQIGASLVEMLVGNTGQVKLASFGKWDVIVQYYDADYDYYIKWLQYTEGSLGSNEWRKTGIFLDASDNSSEVFEPGILNPGEEMEIELKLNPPPRAGTTVETVVTTPNGVRDSISFVY